MLLLLWLGASTLLSGAILSKPSLFSTGVLWVPVDPRDMVDELPPWHNPQQGVPWARAIFLTPVAFSLPGTVADISPPRNDNKQGDTGSYLTPLVAGDLPEQQPPQKDGEHQEGCGVILVGQHFSSSSLPESVPSHPQGSEPSICDGGAGWPHKAFGRWCGRESRFMRGL